MENYSAYWLEGLGHGTDQGMLWKAAFKENVELKPQNSDQSSAEGWKNPGMGSGRGNFAGSEQGLHQAGTC